MQTVQGIIVHAHVKMPCFLIFVCIILTQRCTGQIYACVFEVDKNLMI